MKIRRIHIRNFRKLSSPLTIGGGDDGELGDGLTVIAGDNEEGKSTVLAAIQSVLFNRHGIGGKDAERMRPFASQVRPEIGIDFDLDDGRYSLRKAFCQQQEAELTGPGGRWTGDAVEDTLKDLLQFEPPARGAADTRHRGIWGLFWVDQGSSFAPLNVSDSSRESLVSALESEVGAVLGGERGRSLVDAIKRRRDTLVTSTGRPRGLLKEKISAADAAETALADLQTRLQEYEDTVDELGRLRGRLERHAREKSVETAEAALVQAEEAKKRINALEAAATEAVRAEELAQVRWSAAAQAWQGRQDKTAALEMERQEAERLRKVLETAALDLDRTEGEASRADDTLKEARRSHGRAEAILTDAERALRRAVIERELEVAGSRLEAAQAAERQAATLDTRARAIRVDDAAVARLRHLEKTADNAGLRLQTIATRIDLAPETGRQVLRDGKPCPDDRPLLLTERTVLNLDGFGRVTVTPGGDDLANRRIDAEAATQALERALADLGVADVAAAETLSAERTSLIREAANQADLIAAHAPDGIRELETQIAVKRQECVELAGGSDAPALAIPEAEARRGAARKALDDTRQAREQAERRSQAAAARHAATRDAWIKIEADRQAAERLATTHADGLERERHSAPDEALRREHNERAEEYAHAKTLTEQRRQALADADAETARLRLDRSRDALERLRADMQRDGQRARDLETALRERGQAGLGERIQETEGALAHARAERDRLQREADAMTLLLDTLMAAEQTAKETFIGPVRERILPYLKIVFPGAELMLNIEDLSIVGLRRDGDDEPFESLSIGTREQVAVLTRLAFADFLRAKGRPSLIILDDALVYADDQRFERMQLVLRKAAETLQIIVLTCRERDYQSLGTRIIRLADCARHGSGPEVAKA